MLAATALGLTVALTGSTVHAVPAADPGRGRPGVQEADPVEGRNAKAAPRPSDPSRKSVVTRLDKAVLPAGGSREVAVAASPKPVEVGGLPVTVAAVPSAKASGAKSARTAASAGPAQVRVDVLSPARAKDLSAGAVLRIQRSDESADGAKVRLSVDYSAFEDAYGGSYGARLRLVQLPACAEFAAPGSKACPGTGTPLATVNDPVANTASAEVTAAPADPDGTSAMAARGASLVALAAGSSSSQGTFGATSLSPSASWSVARSTGGFSWSYPMRTVPVAGGLAPSVGLSYQSQSIDGQTSTTNNQGSWVGEGFSYESGYVERRYKPCADDGHDGSAEQCWAFDNATVVLNGNASQIIKDDTTGAWKLANSDGSKVEKLTGAVNGDDNGEHWRIITPDGKEYWFGLNRLPGWASGNEETQSTWTLPVFGDDSGEPCHNATFTSAHCKQAWRWNLDYVKDPHDNVVSHYYAKEVNHYALNAKTDVNGTSYDRGGHLKRIDYGQRDTQVYAAKAPARVVFDVTERCLADSSFDCAESKRTGANASHWPDVPVDRECKASTKCGSDQVSPTFFTTKRLKAVVTQMRKSATEYQDVDAWLFTHAFLDNGDDSKSMWLSKIDHEGRVGSTTKVPSLDLFGEQMENRVDAVGDNIAPFHRHRLVTVVSETGAQLDINFAPADCTASALPKPGESTKRCYPVKWAAPGNIDPIDDWFHKYVVAEIVETDRTGGGDKMVTRYDYKGPAGWRHSKADGITPAEFLTWGEWQGYGKVTVTSGAEDKQRSRVDYTYLQGRHGDKKPGGGTVEATVTDSTGTVYTDDEDFTGFELEAQVFNEGAVATKVIRKPWKHHAATQTKSWGTLRSTLVKPTVTRGFTALKAGGWRESRSETSYDTATGTGRVTQVDDFGRVVPATATQAEKDAAAKDDTCTRTTYADNTAGDQNFLDRVKRVEEVAVSCGTTPDRRKQVLSDVRTFYDSLAHGAAPVRGLETSSERLASHDGTTPVYQEVFKNVYDSYGRPTSATTPGSGRTTTTYTMVNGLTTQTKATNVLGHASVTDYEPAWGQSKGQQDPNGKRTDLTFDGLGRITGVWLQDRKKASNQTPNTKYSYLVRKDAPLAVKTEIVEESGSYTTEYTLYDSLLRARQKQAMGPGGTRLVADTFYDARGKLKASYDTYAAAGAASDQLLVVRNGEVESQKLYEYDDMGRATAAVFAVAGVEQWRTTTVHEGDRTHSVPPQGGVVSTSLTDVDGQVTEQRQYQSGSPLSAGPSSYTSTRYTYTPSGQLATVTDAQQNAWSFEYDQRGRKVKSVDPDAGTTITGYDDADRVVSVRHEGRGTEVTTAYDAVGRATATYDGPVSAGKKLTENRYDRSGALGKQYASLRYTGATEYFGIAVQEFDDQYRPMKTAHIVPASEGALAGTYLFTNTYNRDGTVQTAGLPAAGGLAAEVIRYGYDELQRPVTMEGLSTYVTGTTWSPTTDLLQLELNTGGKKVWQTFDYERGTKRVTRAVVDVAGSTTGPVKETGYSYDKAGNVLSVSDIGSGAAAPDVQCFQYDQNRRLSEAWTPGASTAAATGSGTAGTTAPVDGTVPSACSAAPGSQALGGPAAYWKSYRTDEVGNRTQDITHDTGLDATKDVTRTFTYGEGPAGPHAVTKVVSDTPTGDSQATYGYDAAGNMDTRTIGGNTETLTWDAGGKLTQVDRPDDVTTPADEATRATYLYGPDGDRLKRKDSDGTTLYLPGMELHLPAGAAKVQATRTYAHAGQDVAVRTDDNMVTFLSSDHHGTGDLSVHAATGSTTQRRFDPYGNARGAEPTSWAGRKGFVGGTTDADTGLTNLGAREYDAGLGKFISVDPLIDFGNAQQMNGYAYANNSPVTFSDPTGAIPAECWEGLITCRMGPNGWEFGDPKPQPSKEEKEVAAAEADHAYAEYQVSQVTEKIIEEVKDIVGVTALQDCASNPGVGTCLKAAAEVASLLLGSAVKVLVKGKKVYKALTLLDDLYDSISNLRKTQKRVDNAKDALEKSKKAKAKADKKRKRDKDSCENHSFLPAAQVLMADGSSRPIADVALGDKVTVTDPSTGENSAREVVRTIVTEDDKHFVDLSVATPAGPAALTSTVTHPFWVASERAFVEAGDLRPGMELLTPRGERVEVTGKDFFDRRQRTHDLTVAGVHAYYVSAGTTPVLVHNCDDIALGKQTVDGDDMALDIFAMERGATTYKEWDDDSWWYEHVNKFLKDGKTRIHVNLDGIDDPVAYAKLGKDLKPAPEMQGATRWEMYRLSQSSGAWSRVTWYRKGREVSNPFE
ncbi:RHS repeat-associated core domain-containing protein [Streptomyces zhihengii]|uniref:RHS repeat-associated core domain-containing protein n=1 Tax=Streptomyces zhihengii TaxID=1818004 RepID=UPI0036459404